jgi:hypothetical protein
MAIDDIRADIAYVKDLVDEGGDGVRLRGGIWMTVAGTVFSLTSLVAWWLLSNKMVSGWWYLGVWLTGSLVCYAIALPLTARLPRSRSAPGRALYATGAAIAATTSSLFCAGVVAGLVNHNYAVWVMFPSIVLASYGAFWFVSATITREKWRHLVAAGSFVTSAGFTAFGMRLEGLLVFAACLVLLAVVPGVIILRTKRA